MINKTKVFEFLKNETQQSFATSHNIFTPEKLAEEIVKNAFYYSSYSEYPKNILVCFNLEFLVELVYNNINVDRIWFLSDHEEKTKFAEKILGIKNIVNEIEEINDMKFNVILTNPPYTDGDNKKIYHHFYNKCSELLDEDGIIAIVSPFAIAKGFVGRKVGDKKLDCQDLVYLNNNEIKEKHFPKVGLDNISYSIVKKGYTGLSEIETTEGKFSFDRSKLGMIPAKFNKNVLSIIEKMFDGKSNYQRKMNVPTDNFEVVDSSNTFVITKILDTNNVEGYYIKDQDNTMTGEFRFFINTLGKRIYKDETNRMMYKRNGTVLCIKTDSKLERDNLIYLLEHNNKLIDFMMEEIVGNGRSPYDTFLLNFKKVDLTKKWNPTDLYKHFKLTQTEVDYIENR